MGGGLSSFFVSCGWRVEEVLSLWRLSVVLVLCKVLVECCTRVCRVGGAGDVYCVGTLLIGDVSRMVGGLSWNGF